MLLEVEEQRLGEIVVAEELYQEVYRLPVVSKSDAVVAQMPRPFDLTPTYATNGEICTLDEIVRQPNPGLDALSSARRERFNLDDTTLRILNGIDLLNRTAFYDFDKGEDETRNYEEVPKHSHPDKVQLLLPKRFRMQKGVLDTPRYAHILALGHDTVEDSKRHAILERWYETYELGMHTFTEEDRQQFFDREHMWLPNHFDKDIYDNALEHIITGFVEKIDPTGNLKPEEKDKIFSGVRLLTRPVYMDYRDYVRRIPEAVRDDPELAFWVMMVKLTDRWDNSHFTADFQGTKDFRKNGGKILKDAVKNIYILEAAKELRLDLESSTLFAEGEEFCSAYNSRMHALAGLTNRNMNGIMRYMQDTYADEVLRLKGEQGATMALPVWFEEIEDRMHTYYHEGNFQYMDHEPAQPDKLFSFKGSLELLDDFLEKREEGRRLFSNLGDPKQVFLLYKYAAVSKAVSALHASFDPFIQIGEVYRLDTSNIGTDEYDTSLGRYDAALEGYHITGFMKD